MAGKPNQDPGQDRDAGQDPEQNPGQGPESADDILADLMSVGELLDRHQGQGEELDVARDGIKSRREQLEEEREAAERALVDDHNAKAGRLGMEADGLKDEERRLKQRQVRAQRKASKLGNKLRDLAADPDAERSTIVTYAAFLATKPDFTAGAVEQLGELDEAVKAAAGQPFALVQGHNFAFGRIDRESQGLVIDTDEEAQTSRAIRLPAARTNPAKHARRKPYYGFFSTDFDHPRDGLYDAYDWVLGRYADEDDVINPNAGWATMSHFILGEGDLPLHSPMDVRAADPEVIPKADDPEEEEKGFWGREDTLFTGPAAKAFLHRVVDARLTELQQELGMMDDSPEASAELGRFMAIAARLGLRIDTREIPIHQTLIGI